MSTLKGDAAILTFSKKLQRLEICLTYANAIVCLLYCAVLSMVLYKVNLIILLLFK